MLVFYGLLQPRQCCCHLPDKNRDGIHECRVYITKAAVLGDGIPSGSLSKLKNFSTHFAGRTLIFAQNLHFKPDHSEKARKFEVRERGLEARAGLQFQKNY